MLSAEDDDIGENAKLTFTISSTGGDSDYFYLDSIYVSNAGVVKINQVW